MVYISFLVTHCTHCVIHIYLFHIDLTLLTSLSSIFRDVMSILHSSKINLKTSECSFDNKDGDQKWSSSEVRNFSRARKCPNPLMFLHGAVGRVPLVTTNNLEDEVYLCVYVCVCVLCCRNVFY